MKNTTLCYLEKDGQYLMLFRNRKKNDLNAGKWVGVGGKFEEGESPDDCLLREVQEETGLTLTRYRCRGIVTFVSDQWEGEYMHLFTADRFTGTLSACDEGELCWVEKDLVPELPLWEGDRVFLRMLCTDGPFFSLKLVYAGEVLKKAVLDGRELRIPEALKGEEA